MPVSFSGNLIQRKGGGKRYKRVQIIAESIRIRRRNIYRPNLLRKNLLSFGMWVRPERSSGRVHPAKLGLTNQVRHEGVSPCSNISKRCVTEGRTKLGQEMVPVVPPQSGRTIADGWMVGFFSKLWKSKPVQRLLGQEDTGRAVPVDVD